MPVRLLNEHSYLRYLTNPGEKGAEKLLHLASVYFDEAKECYVKPCRTDVVLFNEVAGQLLAEACEHQAPRFSAVLFVPVAVMARGMPRLPRWLDPYGVVATWCCSRIPGKTFKSSLKTRNNNAAVWDDFLSSDDAPKIAAFDEWIANNDRNSGNYIRTAKKKFALIDHGHILGGPLWTLNQAPIDAANGILYEAQRRLAGARLDRFKEKMIVCADGHQAAFAAARPQLQEWGDKLLDDRLVPRMLDFLQKRAGPEWMPIRLGMI